jgi:cell division septal protein FtsQ
MIKEKRVMAKPIKETPILYDEEAYRFEMAAQNVVPLTEEERAERLEAYERLSKQVSFAL